MLIEGSSGSSGGLVGEHQPDELMRDGGRWAGRPLAVMSEMKVSQEDVRTRAWALARGRRQDGVAFHDEQGAVAGR